eukprot:2967426-Amphidinium_carterae.4
MAALDGSRVREDSLNEKLGVLRDRNNGLEQSQRRCNRRKERQLLLTPGSWANQTSLRALSLLGWDFKGTEIEARQRLSRERLFMMKARALRRYPML